MPRGLNQYEREALQAMTLRTSRSEVMRYLKPEVTIHVSGGIAYKPEHWGVAGDSTRKAHNPDHVTVTIIDHDKLGH